VSTIRDDRRDCDALLARSIPPAWSARDGLALVTARKLMELDSLTDYYYIRGEAEVSDVFSESTPATPATPVVGAYGIHHRRPLAHWAAVSSGAWTGRIRTTQ
jgi:hypothetical protein